MRRVLAQIGHSSVRQSFAKLLVTRLSPPMEGSGYPSPEAIEARKGLAHGMGRQEISPEANRSVAAGRAAGRRAPRSGIEEVPHPQWAGITARSRWKPGASCYPSEGATSRARSVTRKPDGPFPVA